MKITSCLSALLCSLGAAAQINQGSLVTNNKYFEIPYADTKKEIRTKAVLKGDSYDFMLDSGAPAFISTEIQKKYKFPVIVRSKVGDAGGKSMGTEIVLIDTLCFGPFVFTGIPALVLDLENSPLKCYHLAGNVGSNILRHLIIQFDVRGNTISMSDNDALLKKHIEAALPMRIDSQSDVFFPVAADGDITDTAHFDTGDRQLYEISKRKAEKYASLHPGDICRKGYGVVSLGVGGVGQSFLQYIMKPASLKIGNDTISNTRVYIAGNDKSRMGRDLLNYGILKLDYTNSRYGFEKYTTPYVNIPYNYGFNPIMDGDEVFAGCVWENSLAEQDGLRSGDQILMINNVIFAALPECDIEPALKTELLKNSESISLTYKRKKSKPRTVTLPKSSL